LSTDPNFWDKAIDVVGLYLKPPQAAAEFAFDEKTQVQALDRPSRRANDPGSGRHHDP
jgi:hypothetical protein